MWEYHYVETSDLSAFMNNVNHYGAQGWELVSFQKEEGYNHLSYYGVMKRRVQ